MNNINWDKLEVSIKNIKNPLSIFYFIITSKKLMSDYELSLFIRYYLKYHSDNLFNYNFNGLNNLIITYPLSYSIIKDFYFIINKKNELIKKIRKIRKTYIKRNFWKKTISEQIDHLNNDYKIVKSTFDSTKGNYSFIKNLIANKNLINKTIHEKEIENRLKILLNLLGIKFFMNNEILLITYDNLFEMTFESKIKYLSYLSVKIDVILQSYINIFEFYNSLNLQFSNILNPKFINIIYGKVDF